MAGQRKVRARRKALRPDEILDAALEEFTRHGYAGTRLDDVAARAGVTKGTIYVYFQSKDELFRAMFRKFQRPLLEDMHKCIDTTQISSIEFFRQFLRFIYSVMRTDREGREIFRLMIAEAERFPELVDAYHREVIAPLVETLREVIGQGIARGEIRHSAALEFPEIVMAPAALMHLWLLVFSHCVPMDADRYLEAHLDLMLYGLAQRVS
jgi:AcrR family transcriptional regulator